VSDDKITAETEVSTTELACVLGITGRRIRQLAEDGILEKTSRGRFLLCESVQRYNAASRGKETSPQEEEKLNAELGIKKAKAVIAALEAKELQGKMHRSEDVAAMTEDLVFTIRGMLIALPGRLAVDVTAVQTAAEASEVIRKEVYVIMNELANYRYDPAKYEERVRERRSWETSDGWDADDE